ncbi:MAG: RimK family alpha-L-glutamate ligase [Ardenticatenaceae bacterium]|nr:RimK family alpha-L-glutamate ligase [Ardenticatenaceae bacterium]MCB8986855.1 RimK family alpha-L-glutamate ligase [Ardenticatenaceae bacterium]
MRIGILSRNRMLYSTGRLAQAARAQGHDVLVIDTTTVAVEAGTENGRHIKVVKTGILPAWARQQGGSARAVTHLPPLDAIIPRIGTSITQYGLAVVRQFEAQGIWTTATSAAIACSRDKLHSLQIMAEAGLPIPKTAVLAQPEAVVTAVQSVGGPPVIIKLVRGTQGKGVILAHNLATAAAVMKTIQQANRQALVQEFIAESAGKDLRLIIVGNRCVAAMERHASSEGEFRANLHLGGTAVPITPDKEMSSLAVSAAQAHGLKVAGVDILLSNRGPLVLEVNSSPGLQGIESVTGVDVAGEIISYLEKVTRGRQACRR